MENFNQVKETAEVSNDTAGKKIEADHDQTNSKEVTQNTNWPSRFAQELWSAASESWRDSELSSKEYQCRLHYGRVEEPVVEILAGGFMILAGPVPVVLHMSGYNEGRGSMKESLAQTGALYGGGAVAIAHGVKDLFVPPSCE